MTWRFSALGIGCLTGLGLGAAGLALAQQGTGPEDGGPVLTFGISSTLSATDNYNLDPDNSESIGLFDNRLSLGYQNRRANDTLSLDLSGVLRANEPPNGSNMSDDRRLRFGYDRQGVNSALSFGADYRVASFDSGDPFEENLFFEDDPLEQADLTEDGGEKEQISTRFRFETGLTDPLGFIVEGRYRSRSFTDTNDPDLFDTEIFNLSATTRVTLSPVTDARMVLRYENYTADDVPQTDRLTSSLNLGLTQALSKVDTLDVSLGFQQIETDETILGVRRTDTGFIGSFDLTRELTRGTIGTTFDLRESVNGTTTTWRVNRAMPLPRGALEISFGATKDVEDTIRPVGSVGFTHEMRRSTLAASLERQVTTSSQSKELSTTRAAVDYDYEINSLSDMSFSANVVKLADAGGPTVSDTVRADLRAVYSRDLAQDWRLSSGYEYRIRDEDNVGSATSNRVFLTLTRDFAIRP